MNIEKKFYLESKAWPFEEARRILEKVKNKTPKKGYVLFETGYGPSGLPHIGTFGEVVRTSFVRHAFQLLAPEIPTKMFCVSDDIDYSKGALWIESEENAYQYRFISYGRSGVPLLYGIHDEKLISLGRLSQPIVPELKRIESFKARRREIHSLYHKGLGEIQELQLPTEHEYVECNWHLFPLLTSPDRRREIFDHLRKKGIGVQVNYIPAYRHPVFAEYKFNRSLFPVSEDFYSREISLPLFAELTDSEVNFVIESIRELF